MNGGFYTVPNTGWTNPDTAKCLDGFKKRLRQDGMRTLVNPSIHPELSAANGPEPWQELLLIMHMSLECRQGGQPSQKLLDYIEEDHEGYVLTHQILAVNWAKDVGCAIPEQWHYREKVLAEKVRKELVEDPSFSDLFAERLAVLGISGNIHLSEMSCLNTLLQAQGFDGCWRSPPAKTVMRFRDYTLVSRTDEISPVHTSSLAVCALMHHLAITGYGEIDRTSKN